MELLLNGKTSAQTPNADFLLHWFGGERDPAEFLVLRDRVLGELRATAPQGGVCLLQAEAPDEAAVAPHPRCAELELSAGEAARLFVQFLSGDPGFRAVFDSAPGRFSWLGWLAGALAVSAGWWAWNAF